LTFGLSIPVGAAIGGGCGLVFGGVAGGTAGFASGGALGYGGYKRRAEITSLISGFRVQVVRARDSVRRVAVSSSAKAQAKMKAVKQRAMSLFTSAQEKATTAVEVSQTKAKAIASDKAVQATVASAAGGAVIVGTGGAATGLITGGAIGAAVGVVPAVFTFGLSIPFCAIVGGGCGMATGTAAGGAFGGAVGGMGGYTAYSKREALGKFVGMAKETSCNSAGYVRAKLLGATGGTS